MVSAKKFLVVSSVGQPRYVNIVMLLLPWIISLKQKVLGG